MTAFLRVDVWPGLDKKRATVFMAAIRNPPGKLRSPSEMTTHGVRLHEWMLSKIAEELGKRRLAPLSDAEVGQLAAFVRDKCVHDSVTGDSLDFMTPPSLPPPATKVRIVDPSSSIS
jgi:hypothetical protein